MDALHLQTLHPAAQVAAVVCGAGLIGWLGYWVIRWLRELTP